MGIGNLLSMPLANAVGRRPIFLFSLLLLVVSGIWCACSTSLSSHIAGRNIFSLAAGQSEALAPLIVQEIHFLHQHGVKLSYFVGVQNTLTAALFTATTYIVPSIGLPWWYGIMTIINGCTMILSFFFLTETRFERPEDATGKSNPPFIKQILIIGQRAQFILDWIRMATWPVREQMRSYSKSLPAKGSYSSQRSLEREPGRTTFGFSTEKPTGRAWHHSTKMSVSLLFFHPFSGSSFSTAHSSVSTSIKPQHLLSFWYSRHIASVPSFLDTCSWCRLWIVSLLYQFWVTVPISSADL